MPSFAKAGFNFGERVERRARPDIFVHIGHDVALPAADRDGDDLFLEPARLLRRLGLVLRSQRELVLLMAAQLPFRRDILGRLAHVVAVEHIHEAIADHGIDEFEIAHLGAGPQMSAVLRQRHALLAAGDDDFGVAVRDLLHTEGDRAQARAAHLVQPEGRLVLWNARLDRRLTGWVLALVRGQDLAKDDFVHLARIDLGAGERRLDRGGTKLMRGRSGKGAVERPHGGARRAHDYNFTWHWRYLLDIDRGMRAARFSAILALAIAASEPWVRLWYRIWMQFFASRNCNGFWLRRYANILILMQTAAWTREAKRGLSPSKPLARSRQPA